METIAKYIAKLILIAFFSAGLFFADVHPVVAVFLSIITADLLILNAEVEKLRG